MAEETKTAPSFKDTLNLPKTDFPMRSNHKELDAQMLARWEAAQLFRASFEHNSGSKKFILHDGPPYANGPIHLGHAYNKILKDIVAKSHRMAGFHVPVTPGWDCHGLPIEINVAKQHDKKDRVAFIKHCRAYAQDWIDVQRAQFKALGVLMDWDRPYVTMDPGYEAAVLEALALFVERGFVTYNYKSVPWCASCQTSLASAEIEYSDRKDPSVFVLFPLTNTNGLSQVNNPAHPGLNPAHPGLNPAHPEPVEGCSQAFPKALSHNASLLIWTTTPWTLPLNRAVAVKPDAVYTALAVGDTTMIVAQALVEKIKTIIAKSARSSAAPSTHPDIPTNHPDPLSNHPELVEGCSHPGVEGSSGITVVGEFKGSELIGLSVCQPLTDMVVPIIANQAIALDEGTACVHIAPGCGPEDYLLGLANKLEIYSPVTPDGRYTQEVPLPDLVGVPVSQAQAIIIEKLRAQGRLLHAGTITHSYPHCWRCHNGLIFRATKQWFLSLEQEGLQKAAVSAINTINFIPEQSKNHLKAAVESRLEWCISRQKIWDVPIPALLCQTCGTPYITRAFVEQIADHVAQEGIEYWDRVPLEQLSHNVQCAQCGGTSFKKERDIIDVWFDSGVSHFAVLKRNPALAFPADMYLEGRDQARGWFQSSLLTSMVLEKKPAMRTIITHGYVVDANRAKMSKSVGNVVSPAEIIEQYGTDVLRLWAASIDYADDAVISEVLLRNLQEVYRKMRNTLRFLVSNLSDFSADRDLVDTTHLAAIDRYALHALAQVNIRVRDAYDRADFTAVVHVLTDYCTNELSSLYLDIIKDRLYCDSADSQSRRSAQTVCWHILDTLTKLLAPILSFTAEQVSDYYQKNKTVSIHLQSFAPVLSVGQGDEQASTPLHLQIHAPVPADTHSLGWQQLFIIRDAILKAIEIQREQGIIKHSLESRVLIFFDKEILDKLAWLLAVLSSRNQLLEDFLRECCIVSQVVSSPDSGNLAASAVPGVYLAIERARGVKCPRCWQYEETTHEHQLCKRCAVLIRSSE